MRWLAILPLACLLILHSPSGTELRFESQHVSVYQPLPKGSEGHVAPGVKTLIHTGGQKFGVVETVEQIDAMLESCGQD